MVAPAIVCPFPSSDPRDSCSSQKTCTLHVIQVIYRPKCHLAGTDMDAGLAEVLKQEGKGLAVHTLPQVTYLSDMSVHYR